MREIGVRELKLSLSETLRAVSRGQQVRVTMRGTPIADIVPAGMSSGDGLMRKLVVEGRLTMPTRPRAAKAPRMAKSTCSPSLLVLAERDEQP